jgi:hypothetical protein
MSKACFKREGIMRTVYIELESIFTGFRDKKERLKYMTLKLMVSRGKCSMLKLISYYSVVKNL